MIDFASVENAKALDEDIKSRSSPGSMRPCRLECSGIENGS